MDPTDFITNLIAKMNPLLGATIVGDIALVKVAVSGVKKLWPALCGNFTQTIAAVVAIVVVTIEGALAGAFPHFSWRHDALAILLASLVVWLGAMGLHTLVNNQNSLKQESSSPPAAPYPTS